MNDSIAFSIVVAVQCSNDNVAEILRVLEPLGRDGVECLICHAGDDSRHLKDITTGDRLRVLAGTSRSLIPHLWRDGIRAAKGMRVAITTAHCIPAPDWLDRLLMVDLDRVVGVGGVFENAPKANARDWAIFILRYGAFAAPGRAGRVSEIAADNAVYRRDDLLRHGDLLDRGFWEPSFHARFRAEGLTLEIDPTLRVIHTNQYDGWRFLAQRFAHGREFAIARAEGLSLPRLLGLIALSPLLPAVFLGKILMTPNPELMARARRPKVLSWLLVFVGGWGVGEACGYVSALSTRFRRRRG